MSNAHATASAHRAGLSPRSTANKAAQARVGPGRCTFCLARQATLVSDDRCALIVNLPMPIKNNWRSSDDVGGADATSELGLWRASLHPNFFGNEAGHPLLQLWSLTPFQTRPTLGRKLAPPEQAIGTL